MAEDDEAGREGPDAAATGARGQETARDDYGVGRLLALSDGVFAVALTLLVLDITVVPPPAGASSADALRALQSKVSALGIYGFSFVMVSIYWLNHHRGLRTLRVTTRAVLYRNLWLLGLVCLVPFATAFFDRFSNTTAGEQVYLGTMFLLGLLSALVVPWRARARAALRGPGGRSHAAAVYLEQLGSLPVFAAGILLAFWIPGDAALVVLCLIVLLGITRWALARGFLERPPDPDRYGMGRMLALSDDVFAIALTLLVLNIAIPRLGVAGTEAQAVALLRNREGSLIAFGISFLVVGIYWVQHHRTLRGLTTTSRDILRRNLLFLFAVCLVPFITQFFDAWQSTVFGNQFFFGAYGLLGVLSTFVGPWSSMIRATLHEGRRALRAAEALTISTGTLPVCVIGIVLAPVVGPGNVQLVWLLMVPVVLLGRALPGEGGRPRRA